MPLYHHAPAKKLAILGTRGVPAAHGGFETFAEYLSLYLTKKGWEVTVYCQNEIGEPYAQDEWNRITRIHIPGRSEGAIGTMQFDWQSIQHVKKAHPQLVLTLGYNTASFCIALRLSGITNIINMDGIEWMRDKWKPHERLWLWLNERAGCLLGNHLVADHPEIANHLATRVSRKKITTIPYGAPSITEADESVLGSYRLKKNNYAIVIARAEPENSILEIVAAFSQKKRDFNLVVLGNYDLENNSYHQAIHNIASNEVIFLGAIYDQKIVQSLRFYAKFYIHGHRVGGTNPSLVESLGTGSAILAHDNRFNRWVASDGGVYFNDITSCEEKISDLISNRENLVETLQRNSRSNFESNFTWERILLQYENLLLMNL